MGDVPVHQRLAVTGSVNQLGEVQPIGGVNEKIEGFFASCKKRGLTGEQGVVIPARNSKHLALRREIVDRAETARVIARWPSTDCGCDERLLSCLLSPPT